MRNAPLVQQKLNPPSPMIGFYRLWQGPNRRRGELLLNHLVSGRYQRRWHGDAEHPGRLGVDDQLELARLHDRQVRRLRALEDAADIRQLSDRPRRCWRHSSSGHRLPGTRGTDRSSAREYAPPTRPIARGRSRKRIAADHEYVGMLLGKHRERGSSISFGVLAFVGKSTKL
jgi:hypothetical protein